MLLTFLSGNLSLLQIDIAYNVSGARRLVKRDSVEPNVSEENAQMSAFFEDRGATATKRCTGCYATIGA
jgi:hypothetical protein